jgi:hypothetical protein
MVGGLFSLPHFVFAQALTSTAAPQQMIPNGAAAYPSTYPATSDVPATASQDSAVSPYASTGVNSTANPYVNATANPYADSAANRYSTPGVPISSVAPYASSASATPSSGPSLMASTVPLEPAPSPAPSSGNLGPSPASRFNATATTTPTPTLDPNVYFEHAFESNEPWTWQLLPSGFMFKPELANPQEYRLGSNWVHDRNLGWLWDVSLGGRAPLLRYGTESSFWPQGWQWDVYGGVTGRLDEDHEVVSTDYHVYSPITMRQGRWEFKFGYSHLSSHLIDEYMLKTPGFRRLNYVRDELLGGVAYYVTPSLRLYTDAGWSFHTDGGAEPWQFFFGLDFGTFEQTGPGGAPFLALCGHLRQERDFAGSFTMQTGWQWRGKSGHLLRIGVEYFNGMSEQYQFYDRFEEQIGGGLWYDF